jgi:hypothetical protein
MDSMHAAEGDVLAAAVGRKLTDVVDAARALDDLLSPFSLSPWPFY